MSYKTYWEDHLRKFIVYKPLRVWLSKRSHAEYLKELSNRLIMLAPDAPQQEHGLYLGSLSLNTEPNPDYRWWTFWKPKKVVKLQDFSETWTKKDATPITFTFNQELLDKLITRTEDTSVSYKRTIDD